MCALDMPLFFFAFAFQRLRLRRLAIGSEQRDFHSTPSSMKVTHSSARGDAPKLTRIQQDSHKDVPFVHFCPWISLPVSLYYFFRHPAVPVSFWPAAFYFQASVLVRRDGSWERPCYHCWDSYSPSLLILPPFPFLAVVMSTPRFLLQLYGPAPSEFLFPTIFLSVLLPFILTFLPSNESTQLSGLIQLRDKQEMASVT